MSSDLPGPARRLVDAIAEAVDAARAQDRPRFDEAVAALAVPEPAVLRSVFGDLVRLLLEESHPAGLSSEDAQALLERVVRSALGWLPDVEVPALVVVLTGALGMQDPDEEPPVGPAVVAAHAVLLVVELLGERPVGPPLALAVGELERHQTIEMP